MKIGAFAKMNHVTAKMLRYYDRIGLLQPSRVDEQTGYRVYDAAQSAVLNWILILKNLDFSLLQIRRMLSGPVDSAEIIRQLVQKRIDFIALQNDYIQKKIQIDQLIHTLEREGFQVKKELDLLQIDAESVREMKKNMPDMDMFLEQIRDVAASFRDEDTVAIMRFDIAHFKQINDAFGFDVGDHVIVACYQLISRHAEKALAFPVIGRAGGDEFIVFAKAGADETRAAARVIVTALSAHDFAPSGCPLAIGGYIGGLCSQDKRLITIRKMIESSIDCLQKAREAGVNSVYIQ